MGKFVVSANYRDRNLAFRWLVRPFDARTEEAVACKSVKMTGVEFRNSNKTESGFGCSVVAVCDTAEVIDQQPEPVVTVQLRFDGYRFRDVKNDAVYTAKEMELKPDGRILAVL